VSLARLPLLANAASKSEARPAGERLLISGIVSWANDPLDAPPLAVMWSLMDVNCSSGDAWAKPLPKPRKRNRQDRAVQENLFHLDPPFSIEIGGL